MKLAWGCASCRMVTFDSTVGEGLRKPAPAPLRGRLTPGEGLDFLWGPQLWRLDRTDAGAPRGQRLATEFVI